jgi:hypothetical protein
MRRNIVRLMMMSLVMFCMVSAQFKPAGPGPPPLPDHTIQQNA